MSRNILVVEDDSNMAIMIRRALRSVVDCAVTTVDGNKGAIEYLAREVPSLVVMDLRHCDGPGEDLIEHIRENERMRGIPIIVQSGVLFDGDFDPRFFEHRIDAAFAKPYTVTSFLRAVLRCLGEAQAEHSADVALIRLGAESRSLDYKARVDLTDKKQRACLAKDVLAFCNSGGGSIVVGVDEPAPGVFERVGLSTRDADSLEVTRLNDALRTYVGTEVSVGSRRVRDEGKDFVIISIERVTGMLAYARQEHPDAGLHPGRIYVRNDAAQSAEVRDAVTLSRLIETLVHDRERRGKG